MRGKNLLAVSFLVPLCLLGCGGGSGGGNPPPPASTITSVNVTCNPTSVQTGSTSQCTATVSGTGSYSSAVTWSAISGKVSSSGLYTAPGTVPTSGSDTVTATSVEDSSKSGGAKLAVEIAPTVTSVAVTCTPTIIQTGQSSLCSAVVSGAGNYNSSVTWSVNGVAGGNATVGTIDSTGAYSAPSIVPMPYTQTITAASASDPTKNVSVPVIVSGKFASASLPISRASGGTITLPDGSSVVIPANALPTDQTVTLSEFSSLPNQPPDQLIAGTGIALELNFSVPIQPSSTGAKADTRSATTRVHASVGTGTSAALIFTIAQQGTPPGLNGAIGLAEVEDATSASYFLPTSVSESAGTSSIAVPSFWLGGFTNSVSSVTVSPINGASLIIPPNLPSGVNLPITLCWQSAIPNWPSFSACSNKIAGKRVLLVVHGMMSCVENAFTPLAQYMEAIKTGDPYDVIVGFDYDWTRHLTDNGNDLENFLEQIAIQQPKSIDIAAHSEGVPVSLYAASQAPHRALIRNIFTMAGPILGTPVPQSGLADLLLYAHYKYGSDSCPASQTIRQLSFDALFNSPFVQDLQPNSSALSDTILPAIRTNLSQTNIFVAGGTNPDVLGTLVYNNPVTPLTGSSPFPGPNDGIVGLDSALAFNSGFVVHPFPPFNLFHPNLPSDNSSNGVLSDIASQVARTNSATQDSLPDLTCDGNGLSCSGTQDHQFNFDGAGFTPNATAATLYQQDQTGSVIALESLTVDGSGNFIWIAPSCLQPMGMYSMFAFDQVLAGNNIMQTVDAGSCGSPNPIPSISVLSPSSVLVGSAPLTLTINGSGFTANSSVEFNLASRVRTYVNSGQITIPLSASDVATVGEFQVIVTNPSPGGGSSNAVSFSVYSGNPTPTITQVYPTSLQVGSAPQTLTINGTGFLASSTVTFNGSPHQANLVSATQLTISLTTSDLATVGTFPVVVTNPPPGGGSSTAAVFAVTADEISNEWTWIGGSSTVSTAGKYGTLGIPSVNNMPGSRYEASSWTDSGGKLWLFGGQGLDSTGALASLNDLWVFDPSADTWVWLSGSKTGGASAVYGVEGVPATTNVPGARIYSSSWIDSTNHLWLFGGQGVGSNGVAGFLDDLWEFDPVAKTWTWVSGSSMSGVPGVYGTQGVPSTSNVPGSRYFAISWIDSKNNLWLFGGEGEASTTFYAQLDDLWEFNPAAKTWTWVSGSSALNVDGVYGTKGVPSSANAPGSRSQGVSWLDSSGNLWLFGGIGWTSSGGGGVPVNDLWKFDPNAKTWVWVAGSSTNYNPDGTVGSIGIYGTQGVASPNNTPGGRTNPANWIDSKGVFWLFGGTGYDAAGTWGSLNDLWKFDPSTSQWTWIGGSNTVNAIGTYGTLGVPASPNIPGSRYYPVAWSDGTGGFWMFGGEGYDSKGVYGTLNDLWRYQP